MTKFGKHIDQSLRSLGQQALKIAVEDANINMSQIDAAYIGNAMAGVIWGQESIRGQVVLAGTGIEGIPIFNIENACASGSSAFHLAWQAVATGVHDVVLALGVEKLYHEDKTKTFNAFKGSTDVESLNQFPGGGDDTSQSIFMNVYAREAREHMNKYGTKIETIAKVAVKNSYNGSLNPLAQYQTPKSLNTIMNSRMISDPIRLLMCSPIGDGAAAVIVCSEKFARKYTSNPIYIASSVVLSGRGHREDIDKGKVRAITKAYEMAGLGAEDLDVVEVHDGGASGEIWAYEHLQLCPEGQAGELLLSGETEIGGRIPVNPSGGLLAKGHPVGATGIAQLAEIVWQLRGQAGKRQVRNAAKVGLTHNNGGYLYGDSGAAAINVLTK